MRRFEARWDGALRATTAFFSAAAILAPAWIALSLVRDGQPAGALLLLFPGVVLPLAAALGPRGYALAGSRLVLERALRPVIIPLEEVRRAGALPDGALGDSARTGGSTAMFGYTGRFRSPRLGNYRLFATRRMGLVVVDTARERLVLSPEHPERFVETLLGACPHAVRWEAPAS
jgi:hypothetical protein